MAGPGVVPEMSNPLYHLGASASLTTALVFEEEDSSRLRTYTT